MPRDPSGDLEMDGIFQALANADRRRMLDLIKAEPGCIVADLVPLFEMSRIGVMKHLKVLERAQLILSEREGRSRKLYFNVTPIQRVYDRWTTQYNALWAHRLLRLKDAIEANLDAKENER